MASQHDREELMTENSHFSTLTKTETSQRFDTIDTPVLTWFALIQEVSFVFSGLKITQSAL